MFSKLNCYKFQTHTIELKETKLQKFLKERNEQILKKCFNIKVDKYEPPLEAKTTKTEEEWLSGNASQQARIENITGQTTNTNVDELWQTPAVTEKEEAKLEAEQEIVVVKESFVNETMQSSSANKKRPTVNSRNNNVNHGMRTKQPTWKSPFSSVTTKGTTSTRLQSRNNSQFSYDLSRDELKFNGHFLSAMKPAPEGERQLLKSGQRREYLMHRYGRKPVVKYNYPEATSWRIGWLLKDY